MGSKNVKKILGTKKLQSVPEHLLTLRFDDICTERWMHDPRNCKKEYKYKYFAIVLSLKAYIIGINGMWRSGHRVF